ncbi:HAD hydrolase-like protein [Gordonia sp. HY002]|uniref:HAD hydrolase-like protein n=1 Tax=Gordonia zhenghanii TaxID=2911516 RepID=UPI001EF10C51|nr:HAD hydrolase-like protein [Gordonia zhenghanii]MCF8570851.1 HAD hydrolase-like protein [Gordonia zhenghanii]MCF8607403.1 HAD hydrolase-like protein [Gordonia zhenghanii]
MISAPTIPGPVSTGPMTTDTVLLFDLDGTITDSYPGISRSFLHALEVLGEPEPPAEFLQTIVGPPLVESMRALGYDEATSAAGVRAYRARYDVTGWLENSVYDGMAELLADLADAGRTMALATSKDQRIARNILDHFGLTSHFAFVGGADDAAGRLGKAAVVRHVLDALDADPDSDRLLMIGDRSHDVDGAASCRVPALGVRWGYAHAGELEDALVHAGGPGHDRRIVETVPQLRKVLGV